MKKKYFIALQSLLLLCMLPLSGQISTSDSLLLKSQDMRVALAERQAALYTYIGREQGKLSGEEGMEYVNRLSEMATELGTAKAQLEMLLVKGLMYTKLDSFPNAILTFQSALEVDTINYGIHVNVHNLLAASYKVLGEFASALDHSLTSEQIINELTDKRKDASSVTKNTIGALYIELGDYDKAEEYLMEALRFAKMDTALVARQISPISNLGELYRRQGAYEKAVAYYQQSLDIAKTINVTTQSPSVLSSLIDISLIQNHIKRAKSFLEEMALIITVEDNAFNVAKYHQYRGLIHLSESQFSQAFSACETARQTAAKAQLLEQERDACECLYKSAQGRGDLKMALNYMAQYQMIKDTMLNEATLERVEKLRVNHELTLLQTKHTYELAQQEQNAAVKSRRQQTVLCFAGIATLLLSGLLFVLYRSNLHRRKSNAQLLVLNSTLDQSNQDLELVLKGLSHDILNNLDLILATGNAVVKPDKSEQTLSLFYDTSLVAVQRTRTYCVQLLKSFYDKDRYKPTALISTNKVLQSVLDNLAPQMEQYNLKLDSTSYPDLSFTEGDCAQIFQNLISNAIHFAKESVPGQISLVMKQAGEEVWLGVKDNGAGVSEEEAALVFDIGYSTRDGKGIGLWLVKEILKKYDERIWIERNEWGGTTFWFSKKLAIGEE